MAIAKCSQGTPNSNCSSRQNFCKINGQAVKNNSIDATLSSITQYNTNVSDTIWNRIHTVLKNIYNYGSRGTRNPSTSNLVNVSDNDEIKLLLYNRILSDISVTNASGNPEITKKLMTDLQTSINNYTLNYDRCNTCNTACNTTCEAADQCTCANQCGECGDCMWSSMCGACQNTSQCGSCVTGQGGCSQTGIPGCPSMGNFDPGPNWPGGCADFMSE